MAIREAEEKLQARLSKESLFRDIVEAVHELRCVEAIRMSQDLQGR